MICCDERYALAFIPRHTYVHTCFLVTFCQSRRLILALLAQRREKDHLTDRLLVGEQHRQSVDAAAEAAVGGMPTSSASM